ncbi:hypothetical protein SUGI_1131240 [Cryptomeria japonica]|nr:hypothetical protein SUGI_1131240 [Cryptomeria japonica]
MEGVMHLRCKECFQPFQRETGLTLKKRRDTALHLAAYHGHVNVVNKLLQLMNGAGNQAIRGYLRVKNEKGNTAFHEAAIGGHRQVIEVLLERDRPPQSEIELQNIISDTRDTPHSIVNDAGDTDLQNVINDGGEITDASEADPQKIISDAAETDLPNITNVVGETALFKAVEEGHEKIVAELLPLTLPQHYWRTDGQTLVHCAVYRRRKEVLKKLIAAKPDLLKQADYLRRTPLHYAACLKGISHIAKIILEKDTSSCYTVDNNHQSALHLAVKEGNVDLVREILKYAKDCIVIGDNEGRNAFHLVIENAVQIFDKIGRRIKTLMFLVISKRLINEADNRGKTPLDIALDNMDTDERLFEGVSDSFILHSSCFYVNLMHLSLFLNPDIFCTVLFQRLFTYISLTEICEL